MSRGAGSRSRSWRNSGTEDEGGSWTNHWTTTPTSPGEGGVTTSPITTDTHPFAAKPLGPTGGRSWAKEGGTGGARKGGRQFLPEWAANDDDRIEPQPLVGTFNSKGHFSTGEKVPCSM